MGSRKAIDYNLFPKQGLLLGKRARVTFHQQGGYISGTIVRDDLTDRGMTIIHLDDGRFVLGDECQYQPEPEQH